MDEEGRFFFFQAEKQGQPFISPSLPLPPICLPSSPSQNVFPIKPQLARCVEASVTHAVVVSLGQQFDLAVLPRKLNGWIGVCLILGGNVERLDKGS